MADVADWNTLTIVAGAASASAIAGFAVSRQISNLGDRFMKALTDHKTEDQEKFGDHAIRLSLLELKADGYTHSGKNPDMFDPKSLR